MKIKRSMPILNIDSADDTTLCCIKCGYSLRTINLEGNCPECGTTLAETIKRVSIPELDLISFSRILVGLILLASGPVCTAIFWYIFWVTNLWTGQFFNNFNAVMLIWGSTLVIPVCFGTGSIFFSLGMLRIRNSQFAKLTIAMGIGLFISFIVNATISLHDLVTTPYLHIWRIDISVGSILSLMYLVSFLPDFKEFILVVFEFLFTYRICVGYFFQLQCFFKFRVSRFDWSQIFPWFLVILFPCWPIIAHVFSLNEMSHSGNLVHPGIA